MAKIDPHAALSRRDLTALGNDVVPELIGIIEQRAAAKSVPFARMVRTLPSVWRHVVLAAKWLDDIEEAGSLAGGFVEIRERRDLLELERFLSFLGVEELPGLVAEARESTPLSVDDDMDPFDIEMLCDIDAEALALAQARKRLMAHVRSISADFPAG
jgi:hypothetical protein